MGGGFDLSSFCLSVFMQALPLRTLNPAQRQETITSRSPASSSRLAARGPLQLECRHLPAGRETGRGALAKEGRRWKGKSCTGEERKTLENGSFVGFDISYGGGGLVWFFLLYCSTLPRPAGSPVSPMLSLCAGGGWVCRAGGQDVQTRLHCLPGRSAAPCGSTFLLQEGNNST